MAVNGSLPSTTEARGRRRHPREAIALARELAAGEEQEAAKEWIACVHGVEAIESALPAGRTLVSIRETVIRGSEGRSFGAGKGVARTPPGAFGASSPPPFSDSARKEAGARAMRRPIESSAILTFPSNWPRKRNRHA